MVTVTVHRGGGTDIYGDPLPGSTFDVAGCIVAPRSSSEPTDRGRQGVIVGLSLYAPAGADLRFSDQLTIPGELDPDGNPLLWDIDGVPGRWANPFTGSEPGIEVALKRAQG